METKLTKQQADDLKAKCQECAAVFQAVGEGEGFSASPIDRQEVVAAIGDGTFWQKLPEWIVRYGPRIFAFILELLEGYIPQPQ